MILTGLTNCPACNADLTQPRAIVNVNVKGKHGQCRACRNRKQRERGGVYTICIECGRDHPPSTSRTCSQKCQLAQQARRRDYLKTARDKDRKRPDRTVEILDLWEQLERCSTHWERAIVRAKIDAVTNP